MIVCGFCDSYSQLDINDIAALKNIEYFVNSGHSLLYSHDNSSFNSTIHRYSKMDIFPRVEQIGQDMRHISLRH